MFDKILDVIDAIGTVGPVAIGGMVLGIIAYVFRTLRKFFAGKLVNSEAISVALDVVQDVVNYMNINVVNAVKIASADGRLTEEEAKQIKDEAINQILKILSSNMKNVLGIVFGDVGEWLSIQVDNVTEKLKNDPNGSGLTHDQVMMQKALIAETTITNDDEPDQSRTDLKDIEVPVVDLRDESTAETPVVGDTGIKMPAYSEPVDTSEDEEENKDDDSVFDKVIDTVKGVTDTIGDVADAVTTVASNFNPTKTPAANFVTSLLEKAFGKK